MITGKHTVFLPIDFTIIEPEEVGQGRVEFASGSGSNVFSFYKESSEEVSVVWVFDNRVYWTKARMLEAMEHKIKKTWRLPHI